MPKPIPAGLTSEHVLRALADLDRGTAHPFGEPTGYELLHEGKRYAPKAVVGLAFRYARGSVLPPHDFSGGEAPGQANYVLRRLGFDVQKKPTAGEDWSRQEVDLVVADYFAMLRLELLGLPYSKSQHRAALKPLLRSRSDGSIEFKHQNISAVLVSLGQPYISGYKPRGNFQGLLYDAVQVFFEEHADAYQQIAESPVINPERPPALPNIFVEQLFEPPPERIIVPDEHGKPWLSRRGRRIDFARRDAENRRLGEFGEQFAFELEKRRLQQCGREDLSGKVEWVAKTWGDGVGFDILSYHEADESEKFVEVKTTGLGKFFPFLVTANEVRCSEDQPQKFQLYRVFEFSKTPRLYVLEGSLSDACELEATTYRAGFHSE